MFIPDPGSWFFTYPGFQIPDLGSRIQKQQQKTGVKKIFCQTIFLATNFTKLNIILFLICWRNNLTQFSKNYWSFYPKNCHQALKNMGLWSGTRYPGSGKNLFRIPDPGSRGQKGTGSRIPDPDPQHCWLVWSSSWRILHNPVQSFNMLSKILKIITPMTPTRKIKQCNLSLP